MVAYCAMCAMACGTTDSVSQDASGFKSDGASDADLASPDGAAGFETRMGADMADRTAAALPTPAELGEWVSQELYTADLVYVAQERPPGSGHWQAVQDLCAQRFAEYGFEVELHDYGTGVNVVGTRVGGSKASQQVLVSAHYDHIPGCAGADDNGTGVAGVLEAARVLSQADYARTLVVACWDEEEVGLVGSKAYAERAYDNGDDIEISVVLEMIGYKSEEAGSQEVPAGFDLLFPEGYAEVEANGFVGDFVVVIGDTPAQLPVIHLLNHSLKADIPVVELEITPTLMAMPPVHQVFRSDHAAFWGQGYPAIMVTDTSEFRNHYYHCIGGPDTVETLDTDFARRVVQMTVGAVAEVLEVEKSVP